MGAIVAVVIAATASTVGLMIAGQALRNALVRDHDLTLVRRERHAAYLHAGDNPLGIFTAGEIDALSFAPRGSLVRGTQFVRSWRCPDPWAQGFMVEDHLLPVYANRLRDMCQRGTLLVEVVTVLGGGMIGVALTDLVDATGVVSPRSQLPAVLLLASLAAVSLAVSARLLVLQEWQSAANRFRELAIQRMRRLPEAEGRRVTGWETS